MNMSEDCTFILSLSKTYDRYLVLIYDEYVEYIHVSQLNTFNSVSLFGKSPICFIVITDGVTIIYFIHWKNCYWCSKLKVKHCNQLICLFFLKWYILVSEFLDNFFNEIIKTTYKPITRRIILFLRGKQRWRANAKCFIQISVQ